MAALIQQAIYSAHSAGGGKFLARSEGFREDWLPLAEKLCASFGARPGGVRCPACVFACPFDKKHVAVVQVADQGFQDSGDPWLLGFHFLVLSQNDYTRLGGDPFELAQRFPAPWAARGELPTISLATLKMPRRTVEQVREVLQRGDQAPTFLGGAQALVDGGKLVFERPTPDTQLVRDLWLLLPTSTRCQLWPASFAFSNELGFDAVVAPDASDEKYADYLTEQQAADYPEGHYELNLQIAAEADDQRELDMLLARRSRSETWRMGVALLVLVSVLVLVGKVLQPPSDSDRIDLPAPREFAKLSKQDQQALTKALKDLALQVDVKPMPHPESAERLITAIAQQLDKEPNHRDPGHNLTAGPTERRLRALLWKYDVPEYRDLSLKPVELVERLRLKVNENKERAKRER